MSDDFASSFVEKRCQLVLLWLYGLTRRCRKCVSSEDDGKCGVVSERYAETVVSTDVFWDTLYRQFDSDFNDV